MSVYIFGGKGSKDLKAKDIDLDNYLRCHGTNPATGPLNMDDNKISKVIDPVYDQDVATKKYVDVARGQTEMLIININDRLSGYINGKVVELQEYATNKVATLKRELTLAFGNLRPKHYVCQTMADGTEICTISIIGSPDRLSKLKLSKGMHRVILDCEFETVITPEVIYVVIHEKNQLTNYSKRARIKVPVIKGAHKTYCNFATIVDIPKIDDGEITVSMDSRSKDTSKKFLTVFIEKVFD